MTYSRRFKAISRSLILVAILLACFGFADPGELPGAESQRFQRLVTVKYRNTPVNVGDPRFEYLDTSRSSFVTAAWYDSSNRYMIIGLGGTHYHYCQMPSQAWASFREARSFGTHYNRFISARWWMKCWIQA